MSRLKLQNSRILFSWHCLFSLCALFLFSCNTSPFDAHLMTGQWKLKNWVIEQTGEPLKGTMDMSFETRNYAIDYGSEKEEGVYWLMGEYLHTIEKGAQEKRVKMLRLEKDSMELLMNRGGRLERILLTRQ